MKFCTKCGNKLSDSMKFCNKCGAKVKSVDKDTENNSDTEDTKDKKDIPNSKNNIDKTIILDAPKIKKKLILILMKILRIISNLFMILILIIKKNI